MFQLLIEMFGRFLLGLLFFVTFKGLLTNHFPTQTSSAPVFSKPASATKAAENNRKGKRKAPLFLTAVWSSGPDPRLPSEARGSWPEVQCSSFSGSPQREFFSWQLQSRRNKQIVVLVVWEKWRQARPIKEPPRASSGNTWRIREVLTSLQLSLVPPGLDVQDPEVSFRQTPVKELQLHLHLCCQSWTEPVLTH